MYVKRKDEGWGWTVKDEMVNPLRKTMIHDHDR